MVSSEILSFVALVIALTSTVINYLVLRIQREPEVVVYAIPDPRRPSIVNLIIENVGKGIAHDVFFESDRDIPDQAFGILLKDTVEPSYMKRGPLVNGVPSLAAGEKRIITWGQYGGLCKGLSDQIINITAIYYTKPPLYITRQKHKITSSIDIRSFENSDVSDHNWDRKISENLQDLAHEFKGLKDQGTNAINISIVSNKNRID